MITDDRDTILAADRAILPGVGAFGEAMDKLKSRGLDKVIYEFTETSKPFLGICLGLQLLYESSEESSGVSGLGILKGKILRIPEAEGLKKSAVLKAEGEKEAAINRAEGDNTYTDATDKVVSILKFCKEPKYRKEIYDLIGVTYQQWNFKAFIEPLLLHDYLELTVPDKPTSPKQQYRTTKKGLLFLETI